MPAAKYILGELVGAGGMGVVYRAASDGGFEPLAIKQLRPELAPDPAMVARFENELRIGRSLAHPCIPRVRDDGITPAGTPFFVMSWCDGDPLGARCASLGLPAVSDAIAIARAALGALGHAHERRVVHGDIKSDNLLVAGDTGAWQVSLIDWGLGRKLDEAAPHATDLVSGTPGYMAPEILRGAAPTIASDIYGMGVVLYELLTGTAPFGAGTVAELFERQLRGDLEPPSRRSPERDIPAYLDRAILRALSSAPADRFPSARDLAEALAGDDAVLANAAPAIPRAVTNELSTTAPTSDWKPLPPPHRRMAAGTRPAETIATSDENALASEALEVASHHLAAHRMDDAATTLETALARVRDSRNLWPVLLSLAAVRCGQGERAEAVRVAQLADTHCRLAADAIGARRVRALVRRLSR